MFELVGGISHRLLRQIAPIHKHRLAANRQYVLVRGQTETCRDKRRQIAVRERRREGVQSFREAVGDWLAGDVVDGVEFHRPALERSVPGNRRKLQARIARQHGFGE
ncbi:hypothetical protein [Rhodoblastus sp.]|uniref:hypothetical protein n=1 Tax=Rhodoblastus sp. TaxID=1962975 RepID=UPI003FD8574C